MRDKVKVKKAKMASPWKGGGNGKDSGDLQAKMSSYIGSGIVPRRN